MFFANFCPHFLSHLFSKGFGIKKNCKMLKDIFLPGCNLEAIPKSMFELVTLQVSSPSHLDDLTDRPCNSLAITSRRFLQILVLHSIFVPVVLRCSSAGKLTNLRALDLSHNEIVEVPEEIFIPSLK